MRDELEVKFTAAREVRRVLDENAGEYTLNEHLINLRTELGNVIDEMSAKDTEHKTAAAGKTAEKSLARDFLTNQILAVAGLIRSIGKKTSDLSLVENAKVSGAGLKKMRDANFELKAKNITELAETNAAGLVKYDYTAEDIAALRAAYTAFAAALSAKDGGITNKSAAYQQLNAAADRVDDLLDDIEDVMEAYRLKKPDLYLKYEIASREVNTGVRHEGGGDEGEGTATP